jgi:hypothetical protein
MGEFDQSILYACMEISQGPDQAGATQSRKWKDSQDSQGTLLEGL